MRVKAFGITLTVRTEITVLDDIDQFRNDSDDRMRGPALRCLLSVAELYETERQRIQRGRFPTPEEREKALARHRRRLNSAVINAREFVPRNPLKQKPALAGENR